MSQAAVSSFPVYAAFARTAFLKMLAYRLRYYTGILTYLLFVAVHYFIWLAIFAGQEPGATVRGFTLEEMVTYVAIGWVARTFYHSNVDLEINELVKTGQISTFLVRPVNFQLLMISQAVGEALFRICMFSVPVLLTITFLFPIEPPASAADGALFFLSTVIGFLILALFNFAVGLLAFWLKSIQGVMRAKYVLLQLASGLLLPLPFFPEPIESVLELLPFQAIAYIPLRFYLGKVPSEELLSIFLHQLFWIAVLLFLGQRLWWWAMKKLTLQGG